MSLFATFADYDLFGPPETWTVTGESGAWYVTGQFGQQIGAKHRTRAECERGDMVMFARLCRDELAWMAGATPAGWRPFTQADAVRLGAPWPPGSASD